MPASSGNVHGPGAFTKLIERDSDLFIEVLKTVDHHIQELHDQRAYVCTTTEQQRAWIDDKLDEWLTVKIALLGR